MASASALDSLSRPGSRARRLVERLLDGSGVALDGPRPWDLQVHDPAFFPRVLRHGSLGLGEAYVEGQWDCDRIDEMIARLLRHGLGRRGDRSVERLFDVVQAELANLQSRSRAFIVGEKHYDRGNDLFEGMLGASMAYSCGYWREAATLDEAQRAKHDLVARKLGLAPGMRVLDIGCGWGSLAEYAARHHGCEVVGITVSEEQAAYARERCAELPVEIRLQDYRDLTGRFDRIVSIGMFEHVGPRNYGAYFRAVRRLLAAEGLFLLQTIGSNVPRRGVDPWINRYVFPNGNLPSAAQLIGAAETLLVMEDWQSFGADYDRTLMAWCRNLEAAWPALGARYEEATRRTFRYFLLACAGAFRAREIQLWQVVFSLRRPGRYDAPR